MVHDAALSLYCDRRHLVPSLLLCAHSMDAVVLAADETKGCASCPGARTSTLEYSISIAGFSPHEAHTQQTFFGWIMPTIKTSEITILQIVGLDAAVVRPDIACLCCRSADGWSATAPKLL